MRTILPLPMVADLRAFGDACALIAGGTVVSYAELAERIQRTAGAFGSGRRLVGIAMRNDVDSVVHYLAALAAGHAVLVASPCQLASVGAGVVPSAVYDGGRVEVRDGGHHRLHPDLALLLSTSGSTGSPKLVRLSYRNVQSNAEAIAESLAIRPSDRAITTLPLHYCYGLSVLHSHLHRGAGIVLTEASVTDPDFERLLSGATTLPGVPHTFDLLERTGVRLPATVRTVTQAGGRMPPEAVRRWAERGQAQGFDFHVMYGQTEATARMLCMPPGMARERPAAVGRAIPGGSIRIEAGELVYAGPNVMMGYADTPDDLALPAGPAELRTGDLARIDDAGLVEIIGRKSRFAKVFGQRIDLNGVEARLAAAERPVWCLEGDGCLLAACLDRPEEVRPLLCRATGLPASALRVHQFDDIPRTASGKPDYPALGAELGSREPGAAPAIGAPAAAVFGAVLGRDPRSIRPDDTFVGLGGDSLTYIAAAAALERALGSLPTDWHTTAVAELGARAPAPAGPSQHGAGGPAPSGTAEGPAGTPWRRAETTAVLRAAAIIAVVASHIGVIDVRGGAHLLVAVAGYNFARFRLGADSARGPSIRAALASTARIALPAACYLAAVAALSQEYGRSLVFGLNLFGPDEAAPEWRYWYVEALVFVLLAAIAVVAIGHRLQLLRPFALAMLAVAGALAARFALVAEDGPAELYTPVAVGWLFAIGWALAVARHRAERAIAGIALLLGMVGYFDDPLRAALVLAGISVMVLAPSLPVPSALLPLLTAVAGASLWIYLTHWQVYPVVLGLGPALGWAALLASVAVGIAAARLDRTVQRRIVRA